MSGLNLVEMNASDMVDVLHFFFEEDQLRYQSGEQAEAGSKMRQRLYRDLYDTEYKYAITGTSGGSTAGGRKYIGKNEDFEFDSAVPGATSGKVKPYIPPTQFNPDSIDPFGGVLDAPLG